MCGDTSLSVIFEIDNFYVIIRYTMIILYSKTLLRIFYHDDSQAIKSYLSPLIHKRRDARVHAPVQNMLICIRQLRIDVVSR